MKSELHISNNKEIIINGIKHSFDYDIEKIFEWNKKILVVLSLFHLKDILNSNMYCFDENGVLLWTVEAKNYPQKSCPITNIYSEGDKLLVYRGCGIEEEINPLNGNIISSELIK